MTNISTREAGEFQTTAKWSRPYRSMGTRKIFLLRVWYITCCAKVIRKRCGRRFFSVRWNYSRVRKRERTNEKERKPLRSTSNTKEKLLSYATSNNGKVTSLFLGRPYYFRYETRLEISNCFIDEAEPRLLTEHGGCSRIRLCTPLFNFAKTSECSIQSFQQQVVDCFLRRLVHGSFSRLKRFRTPKRFLPFPPRMHKCISMRKIIV